MTDVLEIYIIELPKAIKEKGLAQEELKPWLEFLENPNDMEMISMSKENAVAIKEAKKILEEISQDEHERYLAELREKYIRDQKAIEEFGYDNGLEIGINRGKIEVAKEMLKQGLPIEIIVSTTKLTKEEIEKLK